MPIYEYQCESCGHRFETIRKFSDPPVETCPQCGGQVRKLPPAPAFQFKGSGWYVTDYARKDSGAPAKSEGGTESTSSGGDKAGTTAETKSEKTSEKTAEQTADNKAGNKGEKKSGTTSGGS
jgi:putative FmdB family regulatory protein